MCCVQCLFVRFVCLYKFLLIYFDLQQDGGSVVCAIDSQDMRVVSINCEVCGSKAKFLCSNCKRVAYCSANCQVSSYS